MTSDRGDGVQRTLSPRRFGTGTILRWVGLGLLDAVVLWVAAFLLSEGAWLALTAVLIGAAGINYVFLSDRAFPIRWLVPGLVFMVLFTIYPIIYTVYIAATNWSIPNFLTKPQAVQVIESGNPLPSEQDQTYDLYVYRNEAGEFRFLLRGAEEEFFGAPRPAGDAPPDEPALEDLSSYQVGDEDGDGIPERIGEFERLPPRDLFGIGGQLQNLVLDIPDRGQARVQTVSTARLAQARYFYDAEADVMIDRLENVECRPEEGNFVCPEGRELTPGWRVTIGLANFTQVVASERIREPFVRVFVWNVVFAALSVITTLALGLLLALTFQEERMRFRKVYRSLLILPYAVPGFISALVWRGLLNDRFGAVNRLLDPVLSLAGSDGIPWLTNGWSAKAAVLLVNLWLGFPYMMLIMMGALQAIPTELQEAARVDGASAWGVFRRITFPLLMVSTAPLLIGSFAFNFNNFVLVFLLTRGGPPLAGYSVPVGDTDILISFTYNLAITSGRGADFGLASAITIFIFLIVVAISAFSFRYTKRLENIYGSL